MKINVEALKVLLKEQCSGNYNAFARESGINVALVYRILNEQANAGLQTINKLIAFIDNKGLKIEDYIFLP